MTSFADITELFSLDIKGRFHIEILFSIKGYPKYQHCWMGKLPDKENNGKEVYWYGLAKDGSEAYEYDNFQDFSSSTIFNDKSLKDLWDKVEILSIDGCEPAERLDSYLQFIRTQKNNIGLTSLE